MDLLVYSGSKNFVKPTFLSILFAVRSVQGVIKNTLAALASSSGDDTSPADLKESHAAVKTELEKLIAAFEKKLVDAERRF